MNTQQTRIGFRKGMLTVTKESETKVNGKRSWDLECDCGNTVSKTTSDLNKLVDTSNCGCVGRIRVVKSLNLGDRFGRLSVIKALSSDQYGKQRWECLCDCGNTCVKITSNLRKAKMASCGCFVHSLHGKSRSPIYSVWEAMFARCYNTNSTHYDYYGGRGITVCGAWFSFKNFFEDMGERPEGYVIDRIDPCGNYCKENCRWVDRSESSYNTRRQKNNTSGRTGVSWDKREGKWYARIDFKGESITLGSSLDFNIAVEMREKAELEYFGYNKQ